MMSRRTRSGLGRLTLQLLLVVLVSVPLLLGVALGIQLAWVVLVEAAPAQAAVPRVPVVRARSSP